MVVLSCTDSRALPNWHDSVATAGVTLLESVIVFSILLILSVTISLPVRHFMAETERNFALQKLAINLDVARKQARMAATKLALSFENRHYRISIGDHQQVYPLPFEIQQPVEVKFDKQSMPLYPATIVFIAPYKTIKLIISKQGRVRYE